MGRWRGRLAAIGLGYGIGAMPVVYLLGRAAGVDLRAFGSGNVGSHNLSAAAGPAVGLLGFLSDAAKGGLAVALTRWLAKDETAAGWALDAALMGQSWPVFLGGRGGRGVATLMGGILALTPGAAPWSLGTVAVIASLRPLARWAPALRTVRSDVTPIGVLAGTLVWPVACAIRQRSRRQAWAAGAAVAVLVCRRLTANGRPQARVGGTLLARLLLDRDRRAISAP